ncbi:MAG: aminoglycoside phosphotransferase family protein [Acidobacteria bacterium]|nr:aminoglycoside phosphotransferase family protein [Acidobacteriota bacterium]
MNSINPHPELPQIPALLDAENLRQLLNCELIQDNNIQTRLHIEDCRIIRIKYRPGRNCLITCALSVSTAGGARASDVVVYFMVCRDGESAQVYNQSLSTATISTLFGPGVFHLPSIDSVLWIFPNDRKLKGIETLSDAGKIKNEVVPGILRQFRDGYRIAGHIDLRPIQYVPERSCSVRLDLDLQSGNRPQVEKIQVFGKFYRPGECESVWRALNEIWNSDECSSGLLVIPEPMAFLHQSQSLWLKWLTGKTIDEYDLGSEELSDSLVQMGKMLAALHRLEIDRLPATGMPDIRRKLDSTVDLISRARPDLQTKLLEVAGRLVSRFDSIPVEKNATLHGDLHLKNIFVQDDRRIAFIDLDNICSGDPTMELGSFIAYLYFRGLVEKRDLDQIEKLAASFIRAYAETGKVDPDERSLRWHIAAALIHERAYRCLTRLKGDRFHLIDNLIGLASEFST